MNSNSNNPEASKRSLQDYLYLGVKKWLFIKLVWMESRAPLRKTALCEGLRDRFEPRVAEAVRAKRVTDTVSGLCVTLSSKASNSR